MSQTTSFALPPGTALVHDLVVDEVLGSGGFGITYRVHDTSLDTFVAVKEFLPRDVAGRAADGTTVAPHTDADRTSFEAGLADFLREARTLAKFDHPNIVRVRRYFEAQGTGYFVMPYYEGDTLSAHLAQQPENRLPVDVAVALLQPVLDGLRRVHAVGLHHRDLKPDNIYLAAFEDSRVRPILLDFGAARGAVAERSRSMSALLTPGYAPLEQYGSRSHQGPWTDVYGAAATLYRMVVGERPAEAADRVAAVNMGEGDPVAKGLDEAGISGRMREALERGLAVLGPERTPDVEAFQEELTQAVAEPGGPTIHPGPGPGPGGGGAGGDGSGNDGSGTPPPPKPPPPKPPKRTPEPQSMSPSAKRAIFAALGVVVAFGLLAAFLYATRKYEVSGRVLNAQEAGLSGVSICASGSGGARECALTNWGGYFDLNLPARQSYTLTAERDGYLFAESEGEEIVGGEVRSPVLREDWQVSFVGYQEEEAYDELQTRGLELVREEGYKSDRSEYQRRASVERGLALIDQAIDLRPDAPEAYGPRGVAHWYLGNNEACIEDFERFREAEEDRLTDYEYWCHLDEGDYAEAERGFRARIREDGDAPQAYIGLAIAKLRQDDDSGALRSYINAVELEEAYGESKSAIERADNHFTEREWATISVLIDYYQNYRPVSVGTSGCSSNISFAIMYLDTDGEWTKEGWWTLRSGQTVRLPILAGGDNIYFYAHGGTYEWADGFGSSPQVVVGDRFKAARGATPSGNRRRTENFRYYNLSGSGGEFSFELTCN